MPLVTVLMFFDYDLMSAYFGESLPMSFIAHERAFAEQPGARLLAMSIFFLTGVLLWTLMEYTLHRYAMHRKRFRIQSLQIPLPLAAKSTELLPNYNALSPPWHSPQGSSVDSFNHAQLYYL